MGRFFNSSAKYKTYSDINVGSLVKSHKEVIHFFIYFHNRKWTLFYMLEMKSKCQTWFHLFTVYFQSGNDYRYSPESVR